LATISCSQREHRTFPHPYSMLDMNVSVCSLLGPCVARKHALKFDVGAGMSLRGSNFLPATGTQLCHKMHTKLVCLFVFKNQPWELYRTAPRVRCLAMDHVWSCSTIDESCRRLKQNKTVQHQTCFRFSIVNNKKWFSVRWWVLENPKYWQLSLNTIPTCPFNWSTWAATTVVCLIFT
jgi:hypothetical protein